MGKKPRNTRNIVATIDKITLVASRCASVAECIAEKISSSNGKKEKLVSVPDLCVDGYLLTMSQAEEQLKNKGLGVTFVESLLSDADVKYHEYCDGHIIGTYPKANTKVKPRTIITVKYIPQKVIDRSIQMYEEQMKRKAAKAEEKRARKNLRKKKMGQVTGNVRGIPKMEPKPFSRKFVLVKTKQKEN